jgi:hypothetical protein|uniref:Retrovirus-related Pol polyprotein from transposon TNT 1-94-like beta-barrel domain-containing protein n=2 Tax=Picea TaxID=3328 RepID=A0A101LXQ1_PICGL|nr:hypothetical protein ABT39_MTgene5469 [Picea glauca]QHR91530.1 hypothetical protein Q903MT_gene5565 [Picea sitchensis]
MTSDSSALVHCSSPLSSLSIITADGSPLTVAQIGSVTPISDSSGRLSISNVDHVPRLSMNFLSVSQLADLGYDLLFSSSGCIVQDRHSGRQIGIGRILYMVVFIIYSVFMSLLLRSLLIMPLLLPCILHLRCLHLLYGTVD